MDSLLNYCKTGVEEGATLVYGGTRVDRPGYFCTVVVVVVVVVVVGVVELLVGCC